MIAMLDTSGRIDSGRSAQEVSVVADGKKRREHCLHRRPAETNTDFYEYDMVGGAVVYERSARRGMHFVYTAGL